MAAVYVLWHCIVAAISLYDLRCSVGLLLLFVWTAGAIHNHQGTGYRVQATEAPQEKRAPNLTGKCMTNIGLTFKLMSMCCVACVVTAGDSLQLHLDGSSWDDWGI